MKVIQQADKKKNNSKTTIYMQCSPSFPVECLTPGPV